MAVNPKALVKIANATGCSALLSPLGATLRSLSVPAVDGQSIQVALGYGDEATYVDNPFYLGCTVGRYAGRIAKGRFSLAGEEHCLSRNDGENHLHGGDGGFHQRYWTLAEHASRYARFSYHSPSGEAGYPGAVDVVVSYNLRDDNSLHIDYQASCDAPTVLNLTNHSYFNLSGHDSGHIGDHSLQVLSRQVAEYGDGSVPNGKIVEVANSPFDFTEPANLGDRLDKEHPQLALAGGIDHSWVLPERSNPLDDPIARLYSPTTGISLLAYTDQPTLHVYTGNFLPRAWEGRNGARYGRRQGVCLETQNLPNSPNEPGFPSTQLIPGEIYHRQTVFGFSTDSRPCL